MVLCRRFLSQLAAVLLLVAGTPRNSSADAELEQMKADLRRLQTEYNERLNDLERKIRALESAPGRGIPPADESLPAAHAPSLETTEAAKEEAFDFLTEENTTLGSAGSETQELFRQLGWLPAELEKMRRAQEHFEFRGYMRTGFGVNSRGGRQVAFRAPNALAKYRLGNEVETYLEPTLIYHAGERKKEGGTRMEIMISETGSGDDTYDSLNEDENDIALREAFATIDNVFPDRPDAYFWAGQRYYQRNDIHINDFYFLDMSGYGGGLEAYRLGPGKLAVAWIGGSNDSYQVQNVGEVAKQSLDLRWYDFPIARGKGLLWLDGSYLPGGTDENVSFHSSAGAAAGFIHQVENPFRISGLNKWSVQYGFGPAQNFAATILEPTDELDEAWRVRVTEQYLGDLNGRGSWMVAGVYDHSELKTIPAADWFSIGARPMWWLTERVNLSLEAGLDCTKSGDTDGCLTKLTFAPSISPLPKFMSRPSIRAYVTWAHWTSEFEGLVAPEVYGTEQDGLTYGMQAESWW